MSKSKFGVEKCNSAIFDLHSEALWRTTKGKIWITKCKMIVQTLITNSNMSKSKFGSEISTFGYLGFAFGSFMANNQRQNMNNQMQKIFFSVYGSCFIEIIGLCYILNLKPINKEEHYLIFVYLLYYLV